MSPTEKRFQSLFYWITYSYEKYGVGHVPILPGFNPYFIGLPILIRKGLEAILENIKFQSLFYWITYSYKD